MIGIDIVEIRRFEDYNLAKSLNFLDKNFSKAELHYCRQHRVTAQALAGIFAAKEAVRKAFGDKKLLVSEIEIIHGKSGMPLVKILGKKVLHVKISISHTEHCAVAMCVVI